MKLKIMIVFLLIMVFCYGFSNEIQIISIIKLISNPENYDGKKIQVIGVARFEFECNALFISKEAYEYYLLQNAVRLEGSPDIELLNGVDKFNGKYVLIEGYFYKNQEPGGGRSGLYSGKIIFNAIKIWIMELKIQ